MKDFNHPPLEEILTWPKPNHVDPQTSDGYLTPVTIAITTVTLAFIAARCWSRAILTRQFGIDDWSMILAMILSIAFSAIVIIQAEICHIGRHIWDFDPSKGALTRKTIWIAEWFYVLAAFFARFSVLIFYRRLNSGVYTSRCLWATWIGIGYNVAFTVHIPIFLFLIYRPVKAFWLSNDLVWPSTHNYWHGREDVGLIFNGAMSTTSDIYTALIPFFMVRSLQMPKDKRVKLYLLFSSGIVVVAAGVLRTLAMARVVMTYDTTWLLPATWIWTVVELNVTIMAGSVPALKPLIVNVFGASFTSIVGFIRTSRRSFSRSNSDTRREKSYRLRHHRRLLSTPNPQNGHRHDDKDNDQILQSIPKSIFYPNSDASHLTTTSTLTSQPAATEDSTSPSNKPIPFPTLSPTPTLTAPPPTAIPPSRLFKIETRRSFRVDSTSYTAAAENNDNDIFTPLYDNGENSSRRGIRNTNSSTTTAAASSTAAARQRFNSHDHNHNSRIERRSSDEFFQPYYYRFAYEGPMAGRTRTKVEALA